MKASQVGINFDHIKKNKQGMVGNRVTSEEAELIARFFWKLIANKDFNFHANFITRVVSALVGKYRHCVSPMIWTSGTTQVPKIDFAFTSNHGEYTPRWKIFPYGADVVLELSDQGVVTIKLGNVEHPAESTLVNLGDSVWVALPEKISYVPQYIREITEFLPEHRQYIYTYITAQRQARDCLRACGAAPVSIYQAFPNRFLTVEEVNQFAENIYNDSTAYVCLHHN